MPDIKLDFSRVTYSGVLEIIAPIVPGGILAVGTLILNPKFAGEIFSNPYLGYRSRLALTFFLSYVAGFILYLLVGYCSYTVGYILGARFGSKIFGDSPSPWRNTRWRRVAREFLGPDFAPSTDDLYFEEIHKQELQKIAGIQDAEARARQQKFVADYFLPRAVADADWYSWYQILNSYFVKPQWWAPPAQYFLSMLHAASWAVILLMVLNRRHHWFAWAVCSLGLLYGNVGSWLFGGAHGPDPYGDIQTARLLRALRSRPKGG